MTRELVVYRGRGSVRLNIVSGRASSKAEMHHLVRIDERKPVRKSRVATLHPGALAASSLP